MTQDPEIIKSVFEAGKRDINEALEVLSSRDRQYDLWVNIETPGMSSIEEEEHYLFDGLERVAGNGSVEDMIPKHILAKLKLLEELIRYVESKRLDNRKKDLDRPQLVEIRKLSSELLPMLKSHLEKMSAQFEVQTRSLTQSEIKIITAMIDAAGKEYSHLKDMLGTATVSEMNDGGMGSLLFFYDNAVERKCGSSIGEAEFLDEDGTTVSVVINLDDKGCLFELDVWKVDFSELTKLPDPNKLRFKSPNNSQ